MFARRVVAPLLPASGNNENLERSQREGEQPDHQIDDRACDEHCADQYGRVPNYRVPIHISPIPFLTFKSATKECSKW